LLRHPPPSAFRARVVDVVGIVDVVDRPRCREAPGGGHKRRGEISAADRYTEA